MERNVFIGTIAALQFPLSRRQSWGNGWSLWKWWRTHYFTKKATSSGNPGSSLCSASEGMRIWNRNSKETELVHFWGIFMAILYYMKGSIFVNLLSVTLFRKGIEGYYFHFSNQSDIKPNAWAMEVWYHERSSCCYKAPYKYMQAYDPFRDFQYTWAEAQINNDHWKELEMEPALPSHRRVRHLRLLLRLCLYSCILRICTWK